MGDILIYQMTAEDLKKSDLEGASFIGNTRQIIGRTLRNDVKAGGTFTADIFYPQGTGPNVAESLKPGERAITVPIEMDSAVAGFTRPGTWVDVIFTSNPDEELERPATTITLLEHVKVLAFNQQTFEGANSDAAADDTAAVTLAVNVEDAAALRVVDGHGSLSLVLRNPEDTLTTAALAPRTLDELLKIPPSEKHRMEIFRGNQVSQTEFRKNRRTEASVLAIAGGDDADKPRRASNPPVKKN